MEEATRGQRIAAALEQEFQNCHHLLVSAVTQVMGQGAFNDYELRNMLALMKTSAQLAATINKLDRKPPEKNLENRGSIPQESCG